HPCVTAPGSPPTLPPWPGLSTKSTHTIGANPSAPRTDGRPRIRADPGPPRRVVRSEGAGGAPAALVGLASDRRVGRGAHDGAHLQLLVRLDRGLLAAAVGLAPDDRDLGALRDVAIDGGEGEAALLVRGDAREQRHTDVRAVGVEHGVEVARPVVRVRQVEELVAVTIAVEHRREGL